MAKKQDFSSKLQRVSRAGATCPICGNVYNQLKKVEPYFSEESKSWRYKSKNIKVCACNEKEVYA